MTVLDRIVEASRDRVRSENPHAPALRAAAEGLRSSRESHRFAAAVSRSDQISVIAEIKAASPSAGRIVADVDAAEVARSYARAGAAAISVVTEPRFFSGDLQWVSVAQEASGLPVVMKDFIVDERQILQGLAAGADAVLLLASVLDAVELRDHLALVHALGADALVEVHDDAELEKALKAEAPIIGINNRDLRDFSISLQTGERLVAQIPPETTRVAESGIRDRGDIERLRAAGFDAFLVGTSLLTSGNPEAALRALTEGPGGK